MRNTNGDVMFLVGAWRTTIYSAWSRVHITNGERTLCGRVVPRYPHQLATTVRHVEAAGLQACTRCAAQARKEAQ